MHEMNCTVDVELQAARRGALRALEVGVRQLRLHSEVPGGSVPLEAVGGFGPEALVLPRPWPRVESNGDERQPGRVLRRKLRGSRGGRKLER